MSSLAAKMRIAAFATVVLLLCVAAFVTNLSVAALAYVVKKLAFATFANLTKSFVVKIAAMATIVVILLAIPGPSKTLQVVEKNYFLATCF